MNNLTTYLIEKLKISKNSGVNKALLTPFIKKLIDLLYLDDGTDQDEFINALIDIFNKPEYKFDNWKITVDDSDARGNVRASGIYTKSLGYVELIWWDNAEILFKSKDNDIIIKKANKANKIGIKSYKTYLPVVIEYEDNK